MQILGSGGDGGKSGLADSNAHCAALSLIGQAVTPFLSLLSLLESPKASFYCCLHILPTHSLL